ncbi:peroxisomal acyl-CoA oxidase, putative [Ixodes scapularis]|uniref:Acyl-coenzyme A oxidase n=1 Tax=Ixodes scapularis TaxID=6945 RepID=B7PBH4_IXOSC|nr:peroxisomal acyl-CoA oxidase, putative [Ixodes scapularis]|eukprot:XP_002408153.1 peroxisomal acyl-CoA oxidase, putative [Ixodes scapularis]
MATGGVCEELRRERSGATFDIAELTHLLDGGRDKTERRKELEKLFHEDPEFQSDVPYCYLTYSEAYSDALQKCLKIYQKAMVLSDPREILTVADAILHDSTPVHVHFVMFVPALMGHANEEQQAKWLSDALMMKIVGSYAQTELGHGTFIRGLETKATYDPATEEFVLHTPNLSSIKWWPGSLGKTANHAIVLAQLHTKGKCYGIHPFMVQIRSMENHEPLPGITVGEIGPKMGMRAADNGFLKLDHVRIPRENMLMKNAQVTKEGDYIKPASDKLNYGTMVFVRVLLLDMFAFNIARACTIAIRYSAVRRQSEITPGQGENQIMDYQAQQYKLFPLLGLCHSLRAMFANLMELYKQANQDMEQGNLEMLPELHAISSGLKAFCSDMAAKGIETCRLACGGHGFLLISGLPRLYATTVAACTYEGENTVMYLQAARYMIKCLAQPQQLSRNSTFRFLLEPGTLHVPPFNARLKGREAIRQLVPFYRAAAYKQVHRADAKVKSLIKSGLTPEIAWNHSQVDLIIASKVTTLYKAVLETLLSECDTVKPLSASEWRLMAAVVQVLQPLKQATAELSGDSYPTLSQVIPLLDIITELLKRLRPNAVPLVDAFDHHDMVLSSALGSYDGRVYERMYESALKAPLNKTQVHESYHNFLEPLMKSKL